MNTEKLTRIKAALQRVVELGEAALIDSAPDDL